MLGPPQQRCDAAAELAAKLTAERPATRVLFMSGYVGKVDQDVLAGAAAFLSKPFTPKDLRAKVRDVLDDR